MIKRIITKEDATREWVKELSAVQTTMIAKLMSVNPGDWYEVTKPTYNDRVYYYDDDTKGEIIDIAKNGDKITYEIELDDGKVVNALEDDFEVLYDDMLPMWGTMWQPTDACDEYWLEECGGIEMMSECGFRIFYSEEFGYWFGIDGAGYNFYETHWIPLYEKRGLHWHDETEEA